MMLNKETVDSCVERDGDAAIDRKDEIDAVLTRPQLGYRNGSPLAGVSYNAYPTEQDLADPEFGPFLETLADSPLIGGADDMVKELTAVSNDAMLADWLESVERACEIHGIDVSGLETDEIDSPLETILEHDIPDSVLTSDNTLLHAELYVAGLSTEEAADILTEQCETSVSANEVRNSLTHVGLVQGSGNDDSGGWGNDSGEINRMSTETDTDSSAGLTVDTTDF